ncbi:hypothetical protein [Allokutzneria oryzae]|uniref:Uncharacterized protein n=1 Tax=Allokutzneria oryzae TaxID=1378989 RepID=A0ABV5ZZF6_9PSEU
MVRQSFVLSAHCGRTRTETRLDTTSHAAQVRDLLCSGYIVTAAGRLLCPHCACAAAGHRLPPIYRPCPCTATPGHPRDGRGRCAVTVRACTHCGHHDERGTIPAARKAVA